MLPYKTVCILIAGNGMGAGKSTFANLLMTTLASSRSILTHIALPIKLIASNVIGWNGNKDEKGRDLLQGIGELGRKYDQNCWARWIKDFYLPSCSNYPFDFVIIDDFRYPNERDVFQSSILYDTVTVRIMRNTAIRNGHISEESLDDYQFDYIIDNNGDLYDLERKAFFLSAEIISRFNKEMKND